MALLYKYLPPDRENFLGDGFLRFSQPSALNDPFEFFPALPHSVAIQGIERIRRELLTPPPHGPGASRDERRKSNRDYLKRAQRKLQELPSAAQFRQTFLVEGQAKIDAKLGVLSLSRRWDSSLMWSHYTSAHAGYCVGLDRNHSFFQQADKRREGTFICAPVQYSKTRPTIEFRPLAPSDAFSFVLTKSVDWKYEEEERAIALLAHADRTIEVSPFPVALFRVPSDAITEVIVGLRASAQLITKAAALCTSLKVPLYRAKVSETAYDFERERIDA